MFTLFRIILGDFDFPALYDNAGTLGAMYFDTYSDVKADIDGSKNDFELGAYFKTGYDKMLTKVHLKKEKIKDIQNILDTEAGGDESIDFEKWRSELKVNIG